MSLQNFRLPYRGKALAPLGPIGLDLSREKLHLVQMRFGAGRPTIVAACSVDYPVPKSDLLESPRALRRFVSKAMASNGFSGREVVTCIPAVHLRMSMIDYQLESTRSEGQIIATRALELFNVSAADSVIDFLPVRKESGGDDERAALVACADRIHAEAYLDTLQAAGLEVLALEIGPVALRRLVTAAIEHDPDRTVLAINFGRTRSYMTVFSGRRLALQREVRFGERDLLRLVVRQLDVDEDEAQRLRYRHGITAQPLDFQAQSTSENTVAAVLAEIAKGSFVDLVEEIEQVAIFAASQLRGAPIDTIYLLGSIARWPGAEAYLSNLLSMEVKLLDPFAAFDVESTNESSAETLDPIAGIAIATGCSLRQGGEDGKL